MFKKITAFLICLILILSFETVLAASYNGPDLVITDVRINNPYFKSGSDLRFEVDVKNIGDVVCSAGWLWGEAKSGAKTRKDGKANSIWSKLSLYPGETLTWELTNFIATADEVNMSIRCDSASSVAETNENNNTFSVVFKSAKSNPDIIITDITLNKSEFKAGDTADAIIKLKNSGNVDIPYSEIEGELNIDKSYKDFKTVQKLDAGEEISFAVPSVPLSSDHVQVSVLINPDKKVAEGDYSNNSFKKDIYSIEEISYDWEAVRIGGGGYVPHMEMHKSDPDAVYIGTDVAGAFRYDNSIEEWIPVNDKIRAIHNNYSCVGSIETDPDDSNIVYMTLGSGKSGGEGIKKPSGIFRSFDKGENFTDMHVPPGDMGGAYTKAYRNLLAIDPNNTNVLYAVCPFDGLYRTMNAKDKVPKWEKLNVPDFVPPDGTTDLMTGVAIDSTKIVSGRSNIIYVSTQTGGIYKSDNGGASFELLEGSPLTCRNMQVLSNGVLYANVGPNDGGILKYDGEAWTSIAPYKDAEYRSFAVNPFDENMLMAASLYDIYFSDNGGLTWHSVTNKKTTEHKFDAPWHPDTYFANNISFTWFDPVNNKTAWFGDWFGVWKTEDITAEKVKWQSKIRGLEEFCVRNIKPTSGKARLFVGANDNCGVMSTDIFDFF